MSKAGRPMVPAKIKELTGTIRKDRARDGVEFEPLTAVPKPEVWLDCKAKQYFKNLCELLISKQLLNAANVPLVILMSQEYAKYEMACRELRSKEDYVITTKTGYEQPSPWIAIQNAAQKNYREIAGMFGLDPLSSQKIGPAKKYDDDDFNKMMSKYGPG